MRLLLVFLLALALPAQTLRVTTDLPATIQIDGKEAGAIQPGSPILLELDAGSHELAALPKSGPAWRKTILASSALPSTIAIPLRMHLLQFEIQKLGYWKDERSGLIWAAADNGSGVTVSQAHSYCKQLSAGGFRDWRLPEIEELQPLFGGPIDERGYRVVAPLRLSGWAWSATRGNEPAENWTLDFGDGARASVAAGDAGLNRALCVRSVAISRQSRGLP